MLEFEIVLCVYFYILLDKWSVFAVVVRNVYVRRLPDHRYVWRFVWVSGQEHGLRGTCDLVPRYTRSWCRASPLRWCHFLCDDVISSQSPVLISCHLNRLEFPRGQISPGFLQSSSSLCTYYVIYIYIYIHTLMLTLKFIYLQQFSLNCLLCCVIYLSFYLVSVFLSDLHGSVWNTQFTQCLCQ